MRILIVTQFLSQRMGGAEASLAALIVHLSKSHALTVVNGVVDEKDRPIFPASVAYTQFRLKPPKWWLPLSKGTQLLASRFMAIRELYAYARRIEKAMKPDLVISQKPPFPYVSARVMTIAFVRDLEFITYFGTRGGEPFTLRYQLQCYWGWRNLRALSHISQVVANSTYTLSVLKIHKIGATVIPPFIENCPDAPMATSGQTGNILFLSANFAEHKGAKILLALAERLPHRRFVAVGRDTEGLSSQLPENVEWLDWVDSPSLVLRDAAMLIVPSQWPETFGRVVVEAQRLGVPVLASQVGGLPESVGEGGVMISLHDDIDIWQEAVELLYDDTSRYEELSCKAQANAEAFALDRTLQQFDALLSELQKEGRHCA